MPIRAIETGYKGYKHRSRLEARWAVFFDHLGIKYEYEPEGFLLPDGTHYLPDFWLPELNWIVEIKPLPSDFDGQPWIAEGTKEHSFFSHAFEYRGEDAPPLSPLPAPFETAGYIVLYGTPGPVGELYQCGDVSRASYAGSVGNDSPYLMCECEACGALGFQFDGRDGRNKHKPGCKAAAWDGDKGTYNYDSPRILQAAAAARRARFEHKKTGAPK